MLNKALLVIMLIILVSGCVKKEVYTGCKDSLDCPAQMKCEEEKCVEIGCGKEGETGPSAGINPEWLDHLSSECCPGLKEITYKNYFDENCKDTMLAGAPSFVCSACGNGVCEEWESKCNCPEDCTDLGGEIEQPVCGNGICEEGEDKTCYEKCGEPWGCKKECGEGACPKDCRMVAF